MARMNAKILATVVFVVLPSLALAQTGGQTLASVDKSSDQRIASALVGPEVGALLESLSDGQARLGSARRWQGGLRLSRECRNWSWTTLKPPVFSS